MSHEEKIVLPTGFKKSLNADSFQGNREEVDNLAIPRLESTTSKLKNFFSSNLQIQDEAILDILRLREELLQKRES